MGFFDTIKNFFVGSQPKHGQRSTLSKQQLPFFNQMLAANQAPGAGGSYGAAADYYRDLLSNDSQTAQMMMAPEQRYFNEQIIPDLAEQFAGMGSGGLSSSGFRNAAVSAGTDLSERLGAIRAQLRQQGAQGLQSMGQFALSPQFQENYYNQGQPGFFQQISPVIGSIAGAATGGPAGAAAGYQASKMGMSSPYGD